MTQVYPESGNMGRILPEYLSKWTTEKVKSEGVSVITDSAVQDIKKTEDGKLSLSLNTGKEVGPIDLLKYLLSCRKSVFWMKVYMYSATSVF